MFYPLALLPHNEHKPNIMFNHYGVQIVPTLRGASIAQIRVKYNHHMSSEVEFMAKKLNLGACKCYNVFSKKGNEMTEVVLEFDASTENWLKYSALKTQICIIQKELDIQRLRSINDSILEDIKAASGYTICS